MKNKNTGRIAAASILTAAFVSPVIVMVVNAIISPSAAVNAYIDPASRSSGAVTGPFGEPLSITRPSGAAIDRSFDVRGNTLTDQTLSGIFDFSYGTIEEP